ncbi:MAG: helix-turn-helix transcriptional regulator [Actinomycetota bacterium]|nr:helix-turn-helix transcriptional regulator [Actinomycetota bacterium]
MKYSTKPFGQALYEQINAKKIKLRSLAKKTNLNYSYFSKLKHKQNPPPVETMEIIAAGLEIEPEYFFEYRLYKLKALLGTYPAITDKVIAYARRLAPQNKIKVAEQNQTFTKHQK